MKTHIKNLFPLPVLAAGFGLMLAGQATAQTFTTLYSFTGGSDGAYPDAGLILSGNTLYGTAYDGGSSGNGTVFAVNTDGTGFTNLYSFTRLADSDGANPAAGLILSGNTLYGTAGGRRQSGLARCSPSTPMARVLRPCIVSRQLIRLLYQQRRSLSGWPD